MCRTTHHSSFVNRHRASRRILLRCLSIKKELENKLKIKIDQSSSAISLLPFFILLTYKAVNSLRVVVVRGQASHILYWRQLRTV